ncbi:MAG TPA: DUF3185 family protein [Planctomycetota bacterium]|nr:DUF3185 family protein [Planctomycetota bacterium]
MNRTLSIALLAAGVALLIFGLIESDSVASDFSRLFTGEPTDKAVWLLISGGLAVVAGLVGLSRMRTT